MQESKESNLKKASYAYNTFTAFGYINGNPREKQARNGNHYVTFSIRIRTQDSRFRFPCVAFGKLAAYIARNIQANRFVFVTGRFTTTIKEEVYIKNEKDGRIKKKIYEYPLLTLSDIRTLGRSEKNDESADVQNWYPNYLVPVQIGYGKSEGAAINVGKPGMVDIIDSSTFSEEDQYAADEVNKPSESEGETFDFS